MTAFPHTLQNTPGNYVDAPNLMDNFLWVLAMIKGNLLANGGFESWLAGTTFSNPANAATLSDGWSLEKGGTTGATADVTREGTTKDTGSYSAKVNVTVAGSSDSYLRVIQSRADYANFAGLTVTLGMRVKVGTANKVRLSITDGVSTAYSSYHTGDGTWQLLTATITASGTPSALTAKLEITSDFVDAVYADSAFLYLTDPAMSQTARNALAYYNLDNAFALKTNYIDLVPQAAAPAGTGGRVYFDSNDKQLKVHDGSGFNIGG